MQKLDISELSCLSICGEYYFPVIMEFLLLVLDYSIRGSLTPSMSPGFYGWAGRGGSSSMAPELRSWFQPPPPVMYFLSLRVIISTYLAVC
jgi:hypothetical protein